MTRTTHAPDGLIRFVLSPERVVVPDLACRLPGRGMWLSADAAVLEAARARGAFAKAARGPVTVPPDLRATIEDGLIRRIGDTLGFARRAGQAVAGFARAREWLETGRAALVVHASDGSLAERTRLMSGCDVPAVSPLDQAALGRIFGRDAAVHVAVAPGRLAQAIQVEAGRLMGMKG